MKNSPLTAVMLVIMATLVGGITWMLSGDDPIEGEARVVDAPEVSRKTVEVMAITPRERMLKGRLEAELREIEEYRKVGEVLENGTIKVPDVDGTPLYIHPKLVEGVGRYGEPLYATVKYKYRTAVPLKKDIKSRLPPGATPKVKDARNKNILTFGTKPGDEGEGPGAGPSGGGAQAGGGPSGGSQPGAGDAPASGDGD